jgi:hypothetical protein
MLGVLARHSTPPRLIFYSGDFSDPQFYAANIIAPLYTFNFCHKMRIGLAGFMKVEPASNDLVHLVRAQLPPT